MITVKDREVTGEVSDGDRNPGDGGEPEVIECVEITDGFSKRWVSIYNWILGLCRCCDISIHLPS